MGASSNGVGNGANRKESGGNSENASEKKPAEEEPVKKVPLKELFRYATRGELCLLVLGIIVSCCTGAGLPLLSILQGKVSQDFIDEDAVQHNLPAPDPNFSQEKFHHDVMGVVYGYAGMAVGIFTAASLQVTCFLIVCEQMSNRLRRKFVEAILRQDIPWFDKNNAGTLAPKLFDNLERVREGTGDKIGLMFQYLSQFLTGFIVAFTHSWKLTLIMMAFTPIQALCGFGIAKSMSTFTLVETVKYAKAGRIVEQAISSIRTVVALGGLNFEIDRYADAVAEARKAGILKHLFMGISFMAMGLTNFSSFALAFYVGVGWVHGGSLQVQDLMTAFFSVMMGSIALGQAGPQFAVLGAAQGAAASIFEVLDREPEIDSTSKSGITDHPITGNISVEGVDFRYPSRPDVQVLNRISLQVNAGETVALVGASGCGKSTIVGLLLRYYDVEMGRITIDGIPISELNIEYLRNQIAVVSQEPILFNCTIEENIKYGRIDIDEKQMISACKMANAHSFISGMPQGYQTLVGDRGTQLSGGQKQRIAIARALVRDPKILLLDEATSALDAESEGVVQAALDKASKGRTTIIIAHRLSTIRNAHKIIAIRGGQVIEEGTHDSLLKHRGLYYDLVNAQSFTDAVDNVKMSLEDEMANRGSRRGSKVSAIYNPYAREFSREMSVVSSDVGGRARSASIFTLDPTEEVEVKGLQKKDDLNRLKRELKEANVSKTNLFEIISHARNSWWAISIGLGACLAGGLVFPAYSVFFTQILQVFAGNPDDLLKKGHFWALMFLVLAIIQGSTFFLETFFMGMGAENLASDLRNKLFTNIVSQDMGYFDSPLHACGKLCTRLAADVPNLRSAMDFRLSTVLVTLISMCAGVALAFYYGWQMALLVVAFVPILGLGQSLRTRVMQGKHRKNAKDFEDSGKIAMEAIEHVRTVQALTKEQLFYEKFCQYLDGPHRDALKEAGVQGLAYGFASCVIFVLNCISYRLGLYLIEEGKMYPIRVLRVMYAISISATTLGFATSYFPEYMKARLAGGIIFNMLKERSNINNLDLTGKKEIITGKVEFRNVKFSYPQRPQVEILKGLNFSVSPGQTLALVGPSGCGKSTVVSLIERFYDAKEGEVLLDEHDIKTLNPMFTRSQIAIVSQEPILFDASISENIVYGMDEEVSQDRIEEACRLANIHQFVSQLPDSYDTRVGDKGTQLSGGQKQRIAIARALVRNPKILLLDEATSALDTESEKVVQEALDRAREGRTCIVIAHRLSTVVSADSIAVVKDGVIVEQGTHSDLIGLRGVYYELTQKQTLHKKEDLRETAEESLQL